MKKYEYKRLKSCGYLIHPDNRKEDIEILEDSKIDDDEEET